MFSGFKALNHKTNHEFHTLLQVNTPYVKVKKTKCSSISMIGNFLSRKFNSAMIINIFFSTICCENDKAQNSLLGRVLTR